MAIKAKLSGNFLVIKIINCVFKIKENSFKSGISFDCGENWSYQAKAFFQSLVKNKKIFTASIVNFDLTSNSFKIELHTDKGETLNKIMIENGFAKKL